MFERLSNKEITCALDELIDLLGVKEEVPFHDLVAFLNKKDTEGCVQEIATQLGLPIRVNLTYIPKDFDPENIEGFGSTALSRTNQAGHGIEGIVAQVLIPQELPIFGSSALENYPIQVRVTENSHQHPETFATLIAHELSHVLLASLRSPYKDNELHTDLVPIILGLRDIVRKGRKKIEKWTSNTTITPFTSKTITYGYLTDSQFEFACGYVTECLYPCLQDKNRLLEMVKKVRNKLKTTTKSLEIFRDYFNYLDSHLPEKMRPEHAQRIVQLHSRDYGREWEHCIADARIIMEKTKSFTRSVNHYTNSAIKQLKTHMRELESASDQLDQITKTINKDKKILRSYVGIFYRIRRYFMVSTLAKSGWHYEP